MQTPRPLMKPTKQRKILYNAPAHVRHKLLAAHLSQGLRASNDVKSLPLRSGDTVRIVRGDHRGVEGKVTRVDLPKYRVYVEGLTREKVDGTTVFVPVHPSKVIITGLNLDDKWRKKILERKKEGRKKPEEVVEKPEEVVEKPEARPAEKPKKLAEAERAVKAVEEKPAPEKKARKTIKKTERKTRAKKASKKAKPEAGVTETEEEPRPKTRTKRSPGKTAKKSEEEGR